MRAKTVGVSAVVAALLWSNVACALEGEVDATDWGIQLGGPAVFQIMYRPALAEPLFLEVGGFLAGGGGLMGNGSLGGLLEIDPGPSLRPYVAAGAASVFGCGERVETDPDTRVERMRPGCATIFFGYARAGIGIMAGRAVEPVRFTLDVGGWLGTIRNDKREPRRLIIPMAGAGAYW
jgi:hypothetical protein